MRFLIVSILEVSIWVRLLPHETLFALSIFEPALFTAARSPYFLHSFPGVLQFLHHQLFISAVL